MAKEFFNWRQAIENEKLFKQTGNIQQLLQVSLDFWNFFGSGHTYKDRFPKISYYFGRLNDYEGLGNFLSTNQLGIDMWIDDELRNVSLRLCQIGANYTALIENDINDINKIYSDLKYFDLLEDILFDFPAKYGKLRKFDASVRNIQNTSFSTELKRELFKSFLHNCDVSDFDLDNVFYYEKSTNSIVKKTYSEDVLRGVHYYVDFGMDLNAFSNYVKQIFGSEFYEFYKLDMLNDGDESDYVITFSFNSYAYKEFIKRLEQYSTTFDKSLQSLKSEIEEKIVENWLLKINEKK